MKRTMMLMALAAVSAPAWGAGWESALQPSLYSVTFADYALGERLSDKGATGGSWGSPAVPALAMARTAEIDGRKGPAMEFATAKDATSGISFGVTNQGASGAKAFRSAVWVTAFESLPPALTTSDKFAFTVATRADGKLMFMGWSARAGKWEPLHLASGRIEPQTHAWYDLSVWMAKGVGDVVRVQYRLKVGDDYEPLLTDADADWLDVRASGDATIGGVVYRGEGAFDAMAGKLLPSMGLSVHFL